MLKIIESVINVILPVPLGRKGPPNPRPKPPSRHDVFRFPNSLPNPRPKPPPRPKTHEEGLVQYIRSLTPPQTTPRPRPNPLPRPK